MARFDTPIITNDQSIDRVMSAGLPVVLVVWRGASPDAALDAAMREIARNDAGRVLVAKVNADDNPHTAARAGGPLPALITLKDGQEVSRATGITARDLRDHVAYLLGRSPRPLSQPETPAPTGHARKNGHAPTAPVIVTDATFQQEVLDSDLPVLVDLWAPWCGPCRMIAPIVEKLAREYAGRLKVAKLNVDDNPRTAAAYHVQGIPTLLIFKNGRVADRIVGVAPEPLLRGKVDVVLRS